MKRYSVLISILIVAVAASLAMAGPRGPGRGMGPNSGMCPMVMSGLDLTAEQTQQLQAMRETWLKEASPLQNELFSKRTEMRLLWSEANPNREKITAKQQEIFELQRRLQENATQHKLDVRGILTPEQQAKFSAFGGGRGYGRGGMMRGNW
jgi:Spy/CpxP family protein refolding chaperone